ncbi:MAG TPA: metallophosphoesterase family protein [Candidatus Krumholzibacteria bacterium]|nr:metallophosphoesterase family protein [Candidatus Krumholzibacteria bacterium]
MRYILMSDIHGNLEALQAALEAARRYEPYQLMCLGDLVGYGADPEPCIELAGDKANLMLAGNHDLAVAGIIPTNDFNAIARESIDWTRGQLSEEDRELLSNLPLQYIDGEYCYTHASPLDPMKFMYIRTLEEVSEVFASIGQRFCFVGHTHLPVLVQMNQRTGRMEVVRDARIALQDHFRYFINVGSIGQPRDSNPNACMVVLDEEEESLEFVRVPYDVSKSQGKILSNGLPSYLAERLVLAR